MRANRFQRSHTQEWLVLALAVGLSLTLLFFSKNQGVVTLRGEFADGLSVIVRPFSRIGNIVNMWKDYDEMRSLAMELSLENNMIRDAVLENERLRAMLDFKQRTELNLKPASVIARAGAAAGGRMRLDIGADDGVQLNSAVITPHGLVGKISEVADRTSLVQTLVGNSYGVSVILERTRMTGIMRWRSPGEWIVLGLPTGADVRKGDVVVSSGAGSVFPKGIRAGIISDTTAIKASYGQTWPVIPLVDFSTIEEVFVVIQNETDSVRIERETGDLR